MKKWYAISAGLVLLFACAGFLLMVHNRKLPPSFGSLREAVSFISDCLDREDYDKLLDTCTNQRFRPNSGVLDYLKAKHREQAFGQRYAGREFPAGPDRFELGGYRSELGGVGIKFVKVKGKWHLESIVVYQ